jgi:hypothetical protein
LALLQAGCILPFILDQASDPETGSGKSSPPARRTEEDAGKQMAVSDPSSRPFKAGRTLDELKRQQAKASDERIND